MLSQRTASGLRDSRPRSDPYSRVRGHVTHWNRKHLYKPSGTEICSQSDSSCQRRSQISDFIQKIQTLRAFCFLLGYFFYFFLLLYSVSDPVRSCASSASALARTSYNLVTTEAASGFLTFEACEGHDHQNNHLLCSEDCSHCLEERLQYKSLSTDGKHIHRFYGSVAPWCFDIIFTKFCL